MSDQDSNATMAGAANRLGTASMQPSAEAMHIQSTAGTLASERAAGSCRHGEGVLPQQNAPSSSREGNTGLGGRSWEDKVPIPQQLYCRR